MGAKREKLKNLLGVVEVGNGKVGTRFSVVEEDLALDIKIIKDNQTGVQYMTQWSKSHSYTVLVDANGKPLI